MKYIIAIFSILFLASCGQEKEYYHSIVVVDNTTQDTLHLNFRTFGTEDISSSKHFKAVAVTKMQNDSNYTIVKHTIVE
jgi:PBP1b-binding outer membrane lipoprotein LpoB